MILIVVFAGSIVWTATLWNCPVLLQIKCTHLYYHWFVSCKVTDEPFGCRVIAVVAFERVVILFDSYLKQWTRQLMNNLVVGFNSLRSYVSFRIVNQLNPTEWTDKDNMWSESLVFESLCFTSTFLNLRVLRTKGYWTVIRTLEVLLPERMCFLGSNCVLACTPNQKKTRPFINAAGIAV